MLSNKSGAIAGAAMLGTAALLGTNAAYAIKINGIDDPATYAMETVEDTDAIDNDGTKYYHLLKDHTLRAPMGVGARAGDDWTVTFKLGGMVLSEVAGGADLQYCEPPASDTNNDEREDILDSTCSAITPAPTVIAGGAMGGDSVTFLVSDQAASAQGGVEWTTKFAISGTSGDAELTINNITLTGLGIDGDFTSEEMREGVVKLASALDETAMGTDETATVDSGFKMFMSDTTPDDNISVGNMGSFVVGAKTTLLNASTDTTGANVTVLGDLVDVGDDGASPPVGNSTVTVMGDFSFASRVTWDDQMTCGSADSDPDQLIRDADNDNMVSDTTMIQAVNVTSFSAAMYLCITVDNTDDEMPVRIPETENYMAVASYKSLADRVHAPMGGTNALGMIARDGTTVRLPYLTTNEKFRQRLRIVNRGPEAGYSMDFHGEDDMAGEMAEGTLAANSITMMNLGTDDVVTPGNDNNTSGTLIVEAGAGMIDVATVQVNRELGTTDTVVYSAD